jgi:hypothetical protein
VFGVANSLPGGLFYGLKIGPVENIQSQFAGEGRNRAEWHLKKAAQRVEEASRAAPKRSFDTDAQSTVLLNFNAHIQGVEEYINQLQAEEKAAEVKEFAIVVGQTLATKAEFLITAQAEVKTAEDPETQGSLDFLTLRVANTVAAAAYIAAGTGLENEAPDTSGVPQTDEWGNPL